MLGHPSDLILPQADILIGSPPVVLHAINKDKWAETDSWIMATFLERLRRYLEQVKPTYYLFELPQMAEPYLPVDLPYTFIQYANYGIPQTRLRLLLGNAPLPTPLFDSDTWRVHPEIGDTAPSMGQEEYYYSPNNRKRGNRAFRRRLHVEDFMVLFGYPDWYQPPEDLLVKRNMDLIHRTMPPPFSVALGEAVREALATG